MFTKKSICMYLNLQVSQILPQPYHELSFLPHGTILALE